MRYVVIFKAQIKHLDDEYFQMAQYLRENIKIWHQDAEHQVAQKLGKEKWYLNTQVNICELIKTY